MLEEAKKTEKEMLVEGLASAMIRHKKVVFDPSHRKHLLMELDRIDTNTLKLLERLVASKKRRPKRR